MKSSVPSIVKIAIIIQVLVVFSAIYLVFQGIQSWENIEKHQILCEQKGGDYAILSSQCIKDGKVIK